MILTIVILLFQLYYVIFFPILDLYLPCRLIFQNNFGQSSYDQTRKGIHPGTVETVDYQDYQEVEIITAPSAGSSGKVQIYGGQSSFEVKVGAGFHTKTN